jgi:CBS domain-containing protein
MQLREIMTAGVVTADEGEEVLQVARLMRDRGVGSVVICDPGVLTERAQRMRRCHFGGEILEQHLSS